MKKRKLGSSGLEVAPLALGGNVFGWTADEPTSFRLLDAFTNGGRLLPLGPGPQGRRIRDRSRQVA
jgi:aryl-alcohol dehydrogenase-like predicted oxidoreductase